jgi:CHAD domain-containing protein
MSMTLDPKCDLADELVRIIRKQATKTIAAMTSRRMSAKRRIHVARTGTKKLRAALQLLRGSEPKFVHRANRALRDAARGLSPWRDADARIDCLAGLLGHFARSIQAEQFEPVRHALLSDRRKKQPTPEEMRQTWRTIAETLRRFDRRLGKRKFDLDFAAVTAQLCRVYQRARAAQKAAGARATARRYHEWRKATKRHAHQTRLLQAAWPPVMKALRRELKILARQLGDDHDLNVLEARLVKLHRNGELEVADGVFDALRALIGARREELRREALPAGCRLFAERPATVAARLRVWWKVAAKAPDESSPSAE